MEEPRSLPEAVFSGVLAQIPGIGSIHQAVFVNVVLASARVREKSAINARCSHAPGSPRGGGKQVVAYACLTWFAVLRSGLLHDQVTVSVTRPDWPVWS